MKKVVITASLALAVSLANAQSAGLTFSVTTDQDYFDPHPYGYVTTYPGGVANVGMWDYQSEWIVARTEFNLAGAAIAQAVSVSFHLRSTSILFGNPSNAVSPFAVFTYTGDNLAQLGDFLPAGRVSLGNVTLGPAGDLSYSFDVTGLYNAAVARGDLAFGFGVDQKTTPNVFASLDQFTINVAAVPEPSTWALFGVGGLALALARSRRRSGGRPT